MSTAIAPRHDKPLGLRYEREFLPAALEIVETPPSPIGRLGAYCLVAVFAFAAVWAAVGRVDIVAVSRGRIIPTGYTKVVQPFETGVVSAIDVRDGQKVKAGDPLITLDPTMSLADLGHVRNDLLAARVDIARLTTALARVATPAAPFVPPAGASPEQALMGEQFLTGQVAQYQGKLASLTSEEAQRKAERASIQISIEKVKALLPMMEERTSMRKTLFDHQNGSKITYLENLQELTSNRKDLEVQTSRLKEADAAQTAARAKIQETQADFRRGIISELADTIRKAHGLEQDLAKAEQRGKYQILTSPIDGTVQQLAVHTIGGVVTPAETLLSVVPSDSKLEIEAMVSNQDIGFVHPGQNVAIKVDTFSFTQYGLLHGKVMSLSQDAIVRTGSSDNQAKSRNSDDEKSQQSSYSARVSLDRAEMKVGDTALSLSPGMAVSVEIKTGRRRIIDYILSPVLRHAQESMRER